MEAQGNNCASTVDEFCAGYSSDPLNENFASKKVNHKDARDETYLGKNDFGTNV